jgi:hypothetical protein
MSTRTSAGNLNDMVSVILNVPGSHPPESFPVIGLIEPKSQSFQNGHCKSLKL